MPSFTHDESYKEFVAHLRNMRRKSGLTQGELAAHLAVTQSFVSKVERGERRLDIVEFLAFCRALGLSAAEELAALERRISG